MVLFVLRKLILQTRMCSHPVGINVWFLVGPFAYFHTSCVRTAKALPRLRGCAGLPEPSLVAYVVSTIISWPVFQAVLLLRCQCHCLSAFLFVNLAISWGYGTFRPPWTHSSNTHVQSSSGDRCLIFGRTLRLFPYFMCANSEGSGETARMRRLAWAFVGRLCGKYHNLMSWLKYVLFSLFICLEGAVLLTFRLCCAFLYLIPSMCLFFGRIWKCILYR